MTRQEAYNKYASLMEEGNRLHASGAIDEAAEKWTESEKYWDIYFYWYMDENEY